MKYEERQQYFFRSFNEAKAVALLYGLVIYSRVFPSSGGVIVRFQKYPYSSQLMVQ